MTRKEVGMNPTNPEAVQPCVWSRLSPMSFAYCETHGNYHRTFLTPPTICETAAKAQVPAPKEAPCPETFCLLTANHDGPHRDFTAPPKPEPVSEPQTVVRAPYAAVVAAARAVEKSATQKRDGWYVSESDLLELSALIEELDSTQEKEL